VIFSPFNSWIQKSSSRHFTPKLTFEPKSFFFISRILFSMPVRILYNSNYRMFTQAWKNGALLNQKKSNLRIFWYFSLSWDKIFFSSSKEYRISWHLKRLIKAMMCPLFFGLNLLLCSRAGEIPESSAFATHTTSRDEITCSRTVCGCQFVGLQTMHTLSVPTVWKGRRRNTNKNN